MKFAQKFENNEVCRILLDLPRIINWVVGIKTFTNSFKHFSVFESS